MANRHTVDAISKLILQFRESDNIIKLVEVLTEELDEIEQTQIDFVFQQTIDNAVGAQLDIIGEDLGLLRNGLSDTDYRVGLRLQKRINSSESQATTIIDAWKELTGTSVANLTPAYPAGVILYSDNGLPNSNVLKLMQSIVAASVKLSFIVSQGVSFNFDGPDGLGFSSVFDTAAGGKLVAVVEV